MTWLIISAAAGAWTAYWSTGVSFSAGRDLSVWVQEHGLQNELWAAYPGVYGTDLSAYLRVPTFNVEAGRWNTFMRWNYVGEHKKLPSELIGQWFRRVPSRSFYLVSEPKWVPASLVSSLQAEGIMLEELIEIGAPGIFPMEAFHVQVVN